MAQTKQDAAIGAAQTALQFAGRFKQLLDDAKQYMDQSNACGYPAVWVTLTTAPWNADGSISSTPDATPVATNPITANGLNRSENDILGQNYLLSDFIAFMSGGVVPQKDRETPLRTLVG